MEEVQQNLASLLAGWPVQPAGASEQLFSIAPSVILNRLCEEAYHWPAGDKRLPDFSPAQSTLQTTAESMPESSRWLNAGFALLAAGLLGFLIYLALLVLKVVKP